jgi:transcription antitermination factor NusG
MNAQIILDPTVLSRPEPQHQAQWRNGRDHVHKAGWYAVYTRSRHEQTVEQSLILLGVTTYLPKRQTWSARHDRRLRIDVPALPGYLFIRCDLTPELRASVKKTPGVVGLICSAGQPCRIPEEQIASLRILLASAPDAQPISALEVGRVVRIRSGPMKGACGVLKRATPERHRLIVQIDHIGLALSVDLHEADVELAELIERQRGKGSIS